MLLAFLPHHMVWEIRIYRRKEVTCFKSSSETIRVAHCSDALGLKGSRDQRIPSRDHPLTFCNMWLVVNRRTAATSSSYSHSNMQYRHGSAQSFELYVQCAAGLGCQRSHRCQLRCDPSFEPSLVIFHSYPGLLALRDREFPIDYTSGSR